MCQDKSNINQRACRVAGITLAQAETKLSEALDAVSAVMTNQSYSVRGRTYTRADLGTLQKAVEFWDKQVRRLSGSGMRITGGTPT